VQIPIEQFTLKNGLRVVLSEDHAAPTVSLCITYDVGSRNELPGHTGFAHLFEHMMFQGSQNVGKGEHLILVRVNGGDVNGTTSDDSTNYYERVPANQLDMALFLESDRMRALRITQANLDNQRNTVQEERRLRMDNQPYGKTDEILEDLAYDNFAYKHSTMGSMADLNAASLGDVAQFFKTYYAPNNAVLALVGDFKTADTLAKIKKYFEDIPSQPAPLRRGHGRTRADGRAPNRGRGFLRPPAASRHRLQDRSREHARFLRAGHAGRYFVRRPILAPVSKTGERKRRWRCRWPEESISGAARALSGVRACSSRDRTRAKSRS
jgi:secreted Zn-dependent insulinase-like peptidase